MRYQHSLFMYGGRKCKDCGAMVEDCATHDEFHAQFDLLKRLAGIKKWQKCISVTD